VPVLSVNDHKCDRCQICIAACPFAALYLEADRVQVGAACRLCRICLKKCPQGALILIDEARPAVNKDEWRGVLAFVEHHHGAIHPVTFELIGKAQQLAAEIKHPVQALLLGSGVGVAAQRLLQYGVDRVLVYDHPELRHYRADLYTDVFEDCITKVKPAVVLVGATAMGRSLAPRVSTRLRTGLTADCTQLEIKPNTDLVQIRPAFGGNIMAQIVTPESRPQFATVRYKVMAAACLQESHGTIEPLALEPGRLRSAIRVLRIILREPQVNISEAEVLVAAGRGVRDPRDLALLQKLAGLLGGELAVTRPLVEAGWAPYTRQIGLSGRTVKPKLIITCGISGAVQFTACMNTAGRILAINNDRNAPIFQIAHTGIVGDLYEIIPNLLQRIKGEGVGACATNQ
jgi:electron transfer flavoprotein alpha subunit